MLLYERTYDFNLRRLTSQGSFLSLLSFCIGPGLESYNGQYERMSVCVLILYVECQDWTSSRFMIEDQTDQLRLYPLP